MLQCSSLAPGQGGWEGPPRRSATVLIGSQLFSIAQYFFFMCFFWGGDPHNGPKGDVMIETGALGTASQRCQDNTPSRWSHTKLA